MHIVFAVTTIYLMLVAVAYFCQWLDRRIEPPRRRFCPRCGHQMPMHGPVHEDEVDDA